VESTILSCLEERPKLLRSGGVPIEEIESVIGPIESPTEVRPAGEEKPSAPGMLPRHYAPRTPIRIDSCRGKIDSCGGKRIGLLAFRQRKNASEFDHIEILSEKGDLREAAANLFSAIRRLDALNLDLILAESVPEMGLGSAIMDRLRRAGGAAHITESRHKGL
jgi:L-threonylcarbamoyladenylate synthase